MDQHHFSAWLRLRRRWSLSRGWADAIERHTRQGQQSWGVFFRLVDKYRKLRPTIVCYVTLTEGHTPTGRHCVIGRNGRQRPPQRIDVVRYEPDVLHFLRFLYTDGSTDWETWLAGSGQGDVATEDDGKRWVEEEFQVRSSEWRVRPQ